MPSAELERLVASQDNGCPATDDVAPTIVAAGQPSLEEVLLSTVRREAIRTTPVGGGKDDDDAAPTSWSFAARQRSECARVARVFRYARHRMRQELRGLALDHAELLLGAVTRTVVAATRGSGGVSGVSSSTETARAQRPREQAKMEDGDYNIEGEGGGQTGGKDSVRLSGRNLRHEARPQGVWNKRWAMAVDEDGMGELSTLALDESMLEGDADAGLETRAGVGADTLVEWRKAFRQRVISTGGSRHQRERSTNRRCERNSVYSTQSIGCCFSHPVAFDRLQTAD